MTILHIGFPNPSIYRACLRRHHGYSYIDSSGVVKPTEEFDRAVLARYDEEYCDAVIIHAHADCLSADCLSALTARGARIIHYTWDVFDPLPKFFYEWAPHCLTAFTNKDDVAAMRRDGFQSDYLPYGFDDCVYTPYGTTSDKHGAIVFMGNDHEGRYPLGELRREMVSTLTKKFPNFSVFGHGWGAGTPNYYFRPSMEAEAYRSCVAAINLSSYDREGYSSDRLLRAMGCGACVLSKAIPGGHPPGMSDGFNYLEWKTMDDLLSRINYVFENRIRAAVIGRNAADLAHRMYRFDRVIERLEAMQIK